MDSHELLVIHVCVYSLTHFLHLSLNQPLSPGEDQSDRSYLHMEIINDKSLRRKSIILKDSDS